MPSQSKEYKMVAAVNTIISALEQEGFLSHVAKVKVVWKCDHRLKSATLGAKIFHSSSAVLRSLHVQIVAI